MMFQSPSLRGSGRFQARAKKEIEAREVSIPFIAGQWSLLDPERAQRLDLLVSIPFIAGQWSLPCCPSRARPSRWRVSIPFIAGQWSLQPRGRLPRHDVASQSPSLRGSGRFRRYAGRRRWRRWVSIPFIAGQWSLLIGFTPSNRAASRLNPLHCGAVVASCRRCGRPWRRAMFQSPSLRGSGRFWRLARASARARSFQSPSLRGSGRFSLTSPDAPWIRFRFNPLHCGAVVASCSAPFRRCRRSEFQSPSLRGSGRFTPSSAPTSVRSSGFNPLHCGAVVAS